jgi:hypothetical protein
MIDLSDVAGVTVLMRRPSVPTHLALAGLYLAPRQFERVADATCECPSVVAAPTLDGNPSDSCWTQATPVALRDEHLDVPPLRSAHVRVVWADRRLCLLVESETGGAPLVTTEGDAEKRWGLLDDTVECLIRNPKTGDFLNLVVNSRGRCSALVGSADGSHRSAVQPQIASSVTAQLWRLEMAADLRPLGGEAQEWEFNVRRHDVELGSLVWPRDLASPEGFEPMGVLSVKTR